jgi:hypothetical protein
MADGVAITPGSGVTVATEEITTLNGASVTARQVQHVDLVAITADGVATALTKGNGAADSATLRVAPASDSGLATSANQTTANSSLSTIATNTGTTNTSLTTIIGHVDGLEGQLTTITGHVDGIEGSLTTLTGTVTSNRVAVNLISGQAGVSANTGTVDATTLRVTLATDGQTATRINDAIVGEYETVAASQTDQVIGATGASGDYLSHLIVVPATTSPGAVQIKDGSGGSNITVFTGGASSVSNLVPFVIPVGMRSAASGGWRVTTAGNVSVIAVGNFT